MEKWIWRIVGGIFATPVLLMFFVFAKGTFIDAPAALKRAQTLPMEQRQAILESCVRHSKSIKEDHEEIVFQAEGRYESPLAKPMPPEFTPLAPMRVNVRQDRALIKLYTMMDSGVCIVVEGLNSSGPTAYLMWGEMDEREPWDLKK